MFLNKPDKYLRFFIFWLLFIGLLAAADRAFAANPGAHRFDPKFTSEYTAAWNAKHPKAPIVDMGCYYFGQFNPKQAGIPGPGSSATPVPAHEDCMVAEKYKTRVICGEINIKPQFQVNNPDAALLAGEALPCKQVRPAIRNARNAFRRSA